MNWFGLQRLLHLFAKIHQIKTKGCSSFASSRFVTADFSLHLPLRPPHPESQDPVPPPPNVSHQAAPLCDRVVQSGVGVERRRNCRASVATGPERDRKKPSGCNGVKAVLEGCVKNENYPSMQMWNGINNICLMARIPPHFADDGVRFSAKTLRETCHFLAPRTRLKPINVINRNVWKDTRGKTGREEQEGWSLKL